MPEKAPDIERVGQLYSWAYAWRVEDGEEDTDLSGLRERLRAEFGRALAEHDREVAERTLNDAADAWTQGGWANTPRRPDRVADRMAASQYAGDWLRARAADARSGSGDPT